MEALDPGTRAAAILADDERRLFERTDRLFAALPAGYETVSANLYIAFLHAGIESAAGDGWQLKFIFDEHYCAYFREHPSSWRLWLSDGLREKLQTLQTALVTVDGKALSTASAANLLHENLVIDIPAGLGEHVWRLSRAR